MWNTCYIDYVFFIWQGTSESLEDFILHLNCNPLNIKLSHHNSKMKIEFLNVLIQVNALLHAKSSHPKHLIKNIPVGQFLCMRRICSTEDAFEKQSTDLSLRFQARGYNSKYIHNGYKRDKTS